MPDLAGNVHFLIPENAGTDCQESGSGAAEQLGEEKWTPNFGQ